MKRAGIYLVFIGFESVNQETLDEFNKHIIVKELERASNKNLKKHRIYIHGMFVLGSDYDKPGVVKR